MLVLTTCHIKKHNMYKLIEMDVETHIREADLTKFMPTNGKHHWVNGERFFTAKGCVDDFSITSAGILVCYVYMGRVHIKDQERFHYLFC